MTYYDLRLLHYKTKLHHSIYASFFGGTHQKLAIMLTVPILYWFGTPDWDKEGGIVSLE